jgi:hypothetical protein
MQDDNAGEERTEEIERHVAQTQRLLEELMHRGTDEGQRHEERQRHEEQQRHEEHQRHEDQRNPEHNEAIERLERMHVAADHLSEAGLHEIAEQVRHHAEEFKRDLHRQQPHQEDVRRVTDELREHLDALRREVGELREQVEHLKRERN